MPGCSCSQALNREHLRPAPDNLELEARIANFELAARMQLAATDALDLRKENRTRRERSTAWTSRRPRPTAASA